jgi:hypothetical protein
MCIMFTPTTRETLGAIGKKTSRLFQILANETLSSNDSAVADQGPAVENESQRFSLWATNLGLLNTGNSSLDYRLRDAEVLLDAVRKLLLDLNDTLDECTPRTPLEFVEGI